MEDTNNAITILEEPVQKFELGETRYRVIYGPPNDKNERPIAGLIREDMASALEEQLEKS